MEKRTKSCSRRGSSSSSRGDVIPERRSMEVLPPDIISSPERQRTPPQAESHHIPALSGSFSANAPFLTALTLEGDNACVTGRTPSGKMEIGFDNNQSFTQSSEEKDGDGNGDETLLFGSNNIGENIVVEGTVTDTNNNAQTDTDWFPTLTDRLREVEEQQEERRKELDMYMQELIAKPDEEGKPLVTFPRNFADLLETMEADKLNTPLFWARYLLDPTMDSVDNPQSPWLTDEQLRKGLERVRKLDLILSRKTRQATELLRKKTMEKSLSSSSSSSNTNCALNLKPATTTGANQAAYTHSKAVPSPEMRLHHLREYDEQRVESILRNDNNMPYTEMEDLQQIFQIDLKLQQLVGQDEWVNKGIVPTPPSTVSSYSSHLLQISNRYPPMDYLTEERERRHMRERLMEVDRQLKMLHNSPSHRVTETEIQHLLFELKSQASTPVTSNIHS
jgi:hypothetical protein